ncbi:MAG: FHA domain-containing protein [Hyphomicrobiaceae bacterium]|nr:FHA domain-containing protein [Hyphomicrobiaceae bacterium]
MSRPQLALVASLAAFLGLGVTVLSAAPLVSTCDPVEEGGAEKIVCQARTMTGEAMTTIKAVDGDGQSVSFTSEPYTWTANTTALYFVVQTSELGSDQLRRVATFLGRAAFPVGKRKIGIGTVDTGFKERAALGAYRLQVTSVARDVGDASPVRANPELVDYLRDPILKLGNEAADRKALVIVSDGASSAAIGKEQDIVKLARDRNVAIYNLILTRTDRQQSSVMSRLADATGGATRDVSSSSSDDVLELASSFFGLIENGQVLRLDARGLPETTDITLRATLTDGRTIASDPMKISRLTEDPFHIRIFDQLKNNTIALVAISGLGIGFAMILLSLLVPRLRRKSATVDADVDLPEFDDSAPSEPHNTQHGGETQILFKSWSKAVEEAPRGWLQLVDSDQPPVPLRVGSARVGRHRENEICLMNMSVHRRHAVVHVSQDGVFSIHDLGTKNGVVVNGVRYNQRDLADGDLIELGEVKLRFVADEDNLPPSAAA